MLHFSENALNVELNKYCMFFNPPPPPQKKAGTWKPAYSISDVITHLQSVNNHFETPDVKILQVKYSSHPQCVFKVLQKAPHTVCIYVCVHVCVCASFMKSFLEQD